LIELGEALAALDEINPLRISGRVTEVTGLVVRALVPGIKMGEMVIIESTPRLRAEVVGFRGDEAVLMPLGDLTGVGPDAVVSPMGRSLSIQMGEGTLGRVLDGLGEPMDGKGPLRGELEEWSVDRPAPDPAMFGLPVEDDGARTDALMAQNMTSSTHYEPDFDALRRASTRIIVAAGAESERELANRGAHAVAERLQTTAVIFPSHHGGFLGGEYGQAGDPDAFAAKLREVLTEQK